MVALQIVASINSQIRHMMFSTLLKQAAPSPLVLKQQFKVLRTILHNRLHCKLRIMLLPRQWMIYNQSCLKRFTLNHWTKLSKWRLQLKQLLNILQLEIHTLPRVYLQQTSSMNTTIEVFTCLWCATVSKEILVICVYWRTTLLCSFLKPCSYVQVRTKNSQKETFLKWE